MSLEELEELIERYYIEMENELLMNIADKLSRGKPMEIDKWDLKKGAPIEGSGGVNEWQLERLKELGGLNEENAKIIAKYSGKTKKEVEKVFQRAREIGTSVDKNILDLGIKAGILNEINPKLEDVVVRGILSNAISETLTTFNRQNNSLLISAGNGYKDIVNKVSSQVMAGTKTTAKAMQEAVSELAQKGLTGFTARNGAEWSPEAYTKMVLRANTRNTINHIQEERMQLAGNDYIEISSHMGARPLCAEDQGKIFSLSGNTTPIQDGLGNTIKVYAWGNSSYGKPDGILGINCGHSRYAFVPNLSIHREMEFTKKENDDAYVEKQQQRLYERTIRNKKREIEMLKQANAESEYIKKKTNQLSDYRKEYLEFLDKTGRTRMSANEWIGSSSGKIKTSSQKRKQYDNYIERLKNSPYMPKNIEDFDKLRYTNSEEYKQLMREYRTIGKINKQSQNIERDTNMYYQFRERNLETTFHFIDDYYKRIYSNGEQKYTFDNVVEVFQKKPNFYDEETKRLVRSYKINDSKKHKLILISEEKTDELVSMRYGKEKKKWKPRN